MKPISEKEWTSLSKFLSLVLRHRPQLIDMTLEEQGWVATNVLIQKIQAHGRFLDMETLEKLVRDNAKQRFAFNENKTKIRANQGHSIKLDLNIAPSTPPDILYHGTAMKFLDSIKKTGLQKRKRHHVHLSASLETAQQVGARHGKVVVLVIDSKKMEEEGVKFFQTINGVWLTDIVPTRFIRFEEK